jgi:acetolactate decarboxylase
VSGLFKYIKTRSVPQQEKPYKPLSEVTKTQPIFERGNIFGTLVGFRLPQFTDGVSVPGYHMHFISADKSFGGHVLEFAAEDTDIEIMATASFYLLLPANEGSLGKIEVGKDRYSKLEGVEK